MDVEGMWSFFEQTADEQLYIKHYIYHHRSGNYVCISLKFSSICSSGGWFQSSQDLVVFNLAEIVFLEERLFSEGTAYRPS